MGLLTTYRPCAASSRRVRPSCNSPGRVVRASILTMRDVDRESRHPEMLDRWLVRGAFVVVVTLQYSLINDFGYGTRWLAPVIEIILLVPLTALTLRADALARRAHTSQHWKRRHGIVSSTSCLVSRSSSSSLSPTAERSYHCWERCSLENLTMAGRCCWTR